jgi:hypothetical protein
VDSAVGPPFHGIQWGVCYRARAPISNLEDESEMYVNAAFVIILMLGAALALARDAAFFKRTTEQRKRRRG